MPANLEFLAIYVPDLKQAEAYYRHLFRMEVITREVEQPDGLWYALPRDKGWDDLEHAGIELGMLALRREDFVLALFPGGEASKQIFTIGLSMTSAEIDQITPRVPEADRLTYLQGEMLEFKDRFGFPWQIYSAPYRFKSSGEFAGRWLETI